MVLFLLADLHLQVSGGPRLSEGVKHLQQQDCPVNLHKEQDEKEQRVESRMNVELLKAFGEKHLRIDQVSKPIKVVQSRPEPERHQHDVAS